jgi:hypothetical protein
MPLQFILQAPGFSPASVVDVPNRRASGPVIGGTSAARQGRWGESPHDAA